MPTAVPGQGTINYLFTAWGGRERERERERLHKGLACDCAVRGNSVPASGMLAMD